MRHARAVMHAGIANYRFPLKSAAGENVPGIPGACATCNFTYLVRGPCEENSTVDSPRKTTSDRECPLIPPTLQNLRNAAHQHLFMHTQVAKGYLQFGEDDDELNR